MTQNGPENGQEEVFLSDLFKCVRVSDLLNNLPFEKRLIVVKDLVFGLLDESGTDKNNYNVLVSLISDLHSIVMVYPSENVTGEINDDEND